MTLRLFFVLAPLILRAQADPAFEAYQIWDRQHPRSDNKARAQSHLEVSAECVAQWPDSEKQLGLKLERH
jgi:hypothetical protein